MWPLKCDEKWVKLFPFNKSDRNFVVTTYRVTTIKDILFYSNSKKCSLTSEVYWAGGRPRKSWLSHIAERTGKSITTCMREAYYRKTWRIIKVRQRSTDYGSGVTWREKNHKNNTNTFNSTLNDPWSRHRCCSLPPQMVGSNAENVFCTLTFVTICVTLPFKKA